MTIRRPLVVATLLSLSGLTAAAASPSAAPSASSGAAALAVATPTPPPPGRWDDLLKAHNPWRGFEDDDSVLTVTRVFRSDSGKCQPWIKAVTETLPGTAVPAGNWAPAWEAWAPWSKSDLGGVKDCDDFPCDVKFARAETSAMAQTPESDRLTKFESLVAARVQRYRASGPEPYESRGNVIDPWAYLDKKNLSGALERPSAAAPWRARHFNLDPDRMKTLHQILDVRAASGPGEGDLWLRAAYSDHYFDAWGEWRQVKCGTGIEGFTLVQVLVVDFDLLKNTDIISRLARGRMRNAIRANGSAYLDSIFEELKSKAVSPAGTN